MNSYIQASQIEKTLYLTFNDSPVPGILFSQVTVELKKQGQLAFIPKVMTTNDWVDLGGGLYSLILSEQDTDTLGTLVYRVTGAGFNNVVFGDLSIVTPDAAQVSQSFFQDQPAEQTVYLELAGVPATAVAPNQVTCQFKKAGLVGFETKSITNENWFNLGYGYYTIRFTAAELSRVGSFIYTLSGSSFDNFVYGEFTVLPTQNPYTKNQCRVTGKLLSVGGAPPNGMFRVSARIVEFPARFRDSVVVADQTYAYPDSTGSFAMDLIRGATVIIEIPRAGIRHQVVIPDTPTADLISLLPPFEIDFTT